MEIKDVKYVVKLGLGFDRIRRDSAVTGRRLLVDYQSDPEPDPTGII